MGIYFIVNQISSYRFLSVRATGLAVCCAPGGLARPLLYRFEKTMKYKIEIHSLGYEDHAKIVDRPSLKHVTKTDILQAKIEWSERNAIDLDSNFELPFTRITKV